MLREYIPLVGDWLDRTWFRCLLVVSILAYFVVRTVRYPFIDHDVLIYNLIGRAIWEQGILPYDYAFDHKPFLTYFIYGPTAFLTGRFNVYAALTVAVLLALTWFMRRHALGRSVPFVIVFAAFTMTLMGSLDYSANSELVFMPLVMVSVVAALKDGAGWRLLSAGMAVAAFNVNYVAIFSLVPAVAWALWSAAPDLRSFILRGLLYLAAVLGFFVLAFGALALGGMDLIQHFTMQQQFLSGYSDIQRGFPTRFAIVTLMPVILLIFQAIIGLRPRAGLEPLVWAMVLLIASGLFSYWVGGRYFFHYAFTTLLPFMVIQLSLEQSRRLTRVIIVLLLLVSCAYQIGRSAVWFRTMEISPNPYAFYGPIKQKVAGLPVMAVHTSVVPIFYSQTDPLQPLVWRDHADIVYGPKADDYYISFLTREDTYFVLTDYGWCKSAKGGERPVCAALTRDYTPVLDVPSVNEKLVGYTLYQRRDG